MGKNGTLPTPIWRGVTIAGTRRIPNGTTITVSSAGPHLRLRMFRMFFTRATVHPTSTVGFARPALRISTIDFVGNLFRRSRMPNSGCTDGGRNDDDGRSESIHKQPLRVSRGRSTDMRSSPLVRSRNHGYHG
jgi:hypothetical protein